MKKINEIIQYYIQKKSLNRFLIHLSYLLLSFSFSFIIIVFLENIFFLEQSIKLKIVHLSTPILLSITTYIILKFIFQYFSLFGANNKFNTATEIGKEFNSIKDQLLNVLQIKNQENSINEDLKNY